MRTRSSVAGRGAFPAGGRGTAAHSGRTDEVEVAGGGFGAGAGGAGFPQPRQVTSATPANVETLAR